MIAHLAVHKRQGGGRLGHGTGIIPIVLHKNLACVESVCQIVKSQPSKEAKDQSEDCHDWNSTATPKGGRLCFDFSPYDTITCHVVS